MSRFIETRSGLVNLDYVTMIHTPVRTSEGWQILIEANAGNNTQHFDTRQEAEAAYESYKREVLMNEG